MKRIILGLILVASIVALSIAVAPNASSSAPTYNTVITSPAVATFGAPACATEARGILDGMTDRMENTPSSSAPGAPVCTSYDTSCYFDCVSDVDDYYREKMEDPIADREEDIEDAKLAGELAYAIGLALYNSGDTVAGCAAMNGAAAGAASAADAADAAYLVKEGIQAAKWVSGMIECCDCKP